MAFVNEYIPAEDVKKYGIDEIDLRYVVGGTSSRSWTIDREKNIYLRWVANGREDTFHQSTWNLYWKGELIEIGIDIVDTSGSRNQPCWSHKRIRYIVLPPQLQDHREEIISCLREALMAYKDGGVFSSSTSYSMTLDV